MKKLIFLLLFLVNISHAFSSPDLSRIRVVQTLMDSARTQADLNYASRMMWKIWEEELVDKERMIVESLPLELSRKFKRSMRQWRKHVEQMSRIRSELFLIDVTNSLYREERKPNRAKQMKPYVYNMSMAIYYEEKWIELDILLNMN